MRVPKQCAQAIHEAERLLKRWSALRDYEIRSLGQCAPSVDLQVRSLKRHLDSLWSTAALYDATSDWSSCEIFPDEELY
jgi:hypothetical protein